jgi:hypothetical protein
MRPRLRKRFDLDAEVSSSGLDQAAGSIDRTAAFRAVSRLPFRRQGGDLRASASGRRRT